MEESGRPEGERPLGKSKRRWDDDFKMDLRYRPIVWRHLDQNRNRKLAFVSTVMNFQVY